eukprot:jgi/Picsp_1/2330/NSC_05793-R1_twin arginine targeting family
MAPCVSRRRAAQRCCSRGKHIPLSRPIIDSGRLPISPQRSRNISCNGLFGLGAPELAVIVGVVALVYGPSKLPEVGKGLGKTFKSFQSAAKEFEKELKEEMKDDDDEKKPEDGQQKSRDQQ